MPMTAHDALEILARHRADKAVVTTMTAAGVWPELSDTPLDFAFLPSAMGHAPGLALGLALGSGRGVIAVHGDGGTLMNLGCLVTLANNPAGVWLVILDNGLYEVTGGQPVAGAGRTDFAGLARAAGIGRVYKAATMAEWEAMAAEALGGDGPAVIVLSVEGRLGQKTPKPPRPMAEQIARLRGALSAT